MTSNIVNLKSVQCFMVSLGKKNHYPWINVGVCVWLLESKCCLKVLLFSTKWSFAVYWENKVIVCVSLSEQDLLTKPACPQERCDWLILLPFEMLLSVCFSIAWISVITLLGHQSQSWKIGIWVHISCKTVHSICILSDDKVIGFKLMTHSSSLSRGQLSRSKYDQCISKTF